MRLSSWFTLPLLVFLYRPLIRFWPRLDKDAYVRRVVAIGNQFFHHRFRRVPYNQRLLFLPYCLRARECATLIDPENGLKCPAECVLPCRLREMRQLALDLGYQEVFIVVSGRLHQQEGVLRSRDFLVRQIRRHQPRAVIGCLCPRDLREKYLRSDNISPSGSLGRHGREVIPQVCLLNGSNCRQSEVDWRQLETMIRAA